MLFQNRTWQKAQVLLAGTILTPGQRTVASALRVMGPAATATMLATIMWLNRAAWSPLGASQVLLRLLIQHLDHGDGPLVFGIDETLERRRGSKISALGVYRDAVRSSRSYTVKASGLRWVSLMWLGHIPWAGRYWGAALPHRAGAIGTLSPKAGTPPQETHRLGKADDPATAPLAAPSTPGGGGRQRLRRN